MKRVVITGASGFIGANLTRSLLQDGHEVHLLMREEYTHWRIEDIKKDVRIHIMNLNDKTETENLIKTIKPEWIFHLAANGNYSWQNNLEKIIQTNILETINLVEACLNAGFEAFVNTGSSSEYGFKDHPPSEYDWLEPNSYYAVAKASATLFCRYSAQKNRANISTLRLYAVYGPYEDPRRLLPTLIIKGLKGLFPPLVNQNIVRDFVYIDDVIDAYQFAAKKSGQEYGAVYNVGSGVQTTLQNVIEVAKQVMKITDVPHWGSMSDRDWDTSIWIADNQEIKSKLGWRPKYSFENGFHKMVNWFCNNPSILEYYRNQIDI
jgi:nucleoside-diphosphate-sugar epimerase